MRPAQSWSPTRKATSRFPASATQSTVRAFSTAIIDHLEATRWAARKAYKQAGILHPADLNGLIIEQHDAFGPLFLLNLVDLGIFTHRRSHQGHREGNAGQGWRDSDEHLRRTERLACAGRHRPDQIIEACRQLRGEAPTGLQVKKPKVAICHSIGGPGNNIAVTILDKVGNRRYRHHFRRWQPETTSSQQRTTQAGATARNPGSLHNSLPASRQPRRRLYSRVVTAAANTSSPLPRTTKSRRLGARK